MIRAFAPASVANLFVGFDILGMAFDQIGDEVVLSAGTSVPLELEVISPDKIPFDPQKNVATYSLQSLMRAHDIQEKVKVFLRKGIPLSSGLGGSAASAVASVVAANKYFELGLSMRDLLPFALEGEALASGSKHADNIAPSLFGGVQLVSSLDRIVGLPSTLPVWAFILHPHLQLETAYARSILSSQVSKSDWILQSQALASFMAALFQNDVELFAKSLKDVIILPQRKKLIPGFDELQQLAKELGAYGFTISGAGPSLIGFCGSQTQAQHLSGELQKKFQQLNSNACDAWVTSLHSQGARIL